MHFPSPSFTPHQPAPRAGAAAVAREDVQWNRPIFKAPPLDYFLRGIDVKLFAQELRTIGWAQR